MLGNIRGKERCEYVGDYVVYDLETTGISCQYDEVIEISAIRVRGGRAVAEFSSLVNPGRRIPYGASRVNHIYDDMVADKPGFQQVLGGFLAFIGDDVLVGHNIKRFDMNFIYRDCERYFNRTLSNDFVDTLTMAKRCFPGWRHRKLENLAEHYGISTQGAHRALQDCHMNQQVFELMWADMSDRTKSVSDRLPGSQEAGRSIRATVAAADNKNEKICPECRLPMKRRRGRYGEFWGCSGYPMCRHTENIR